MPMPTPPSTGSTTPEMYAAGFRNRSPTAYFFPSPSGGPWSHSAVYRLYRELLLRCGIAHPGRGKGPRIHDLRHAFAVRTLLEAYRDGCDPQQRLTLLSTYLGHVDPAGSYWYLSAAPELLGRVAERLDRQRGDKP